MRSWGECEEEERKRREEKVEELRNSKQGSETKAESGIDAKVKKSTQSFETFADDSPHSQLSRCALRYCLTPVEREKVLEEREGSTKIGRIGTERRSSKRSSLFRCGGSPSRF